MTSVPTVCLCLVQQHGLSPGDVPSYSALQHEVVIICWDGLAGQPGCLSVWAVSVIMQQQHRHHQPAVPGWPGFIPACSMQPASNHEASWPSARLPSSLHPRRPPPPIGSRGWSVSILVSAFVSQTAFLITLPALCPLLVSLGSAPCSRVARPRRNTATFASPPWLVLHCQWLTSPRLGADKRLYAIAGVLGVRFRRVDSTRLGSTQVDPTRLRTAVADLPNFQVCFTVDPGRTATPSTRADGVAALSVASQTIARVHSVN